MMAAAKEMSVDSAEAAVLSGLDDTKNRTEGFPRGKDVPSVFDKSLVGQHGSPQGGDTRLVSRPRAGRKRKKLIPARLLVAVA